MPSERPTVAVLDLVTSMGGVQTVMAKLLPRLAARFRVVVIDAYRNPDYRLALADAPIEQVALGPPPRRRYVGGKGRAGRVVHLAARAPWLLATGLRLRAWIRRERPAVVYFNQLPAFSFFSRFVPRPGPAIVFHAHGFRAAADIRDGPYLGRTCTRIIAVSRAVAAVLEEARVAPARIAVVHNAIDAGELRRRMDAGCAPLPPRAPGEVVVAHVAVLSPSKGQDLAIEALARLPPHVTLWLCGGVADGAADRMYPARLGDAVRRFGLDGRVHFLGWRSDVAAVLAAADVAILPSAEESFGMALAEAMALGKPCVGARVGGIPEVIEDGVTGAVVERTPAALAAALDRLATSPTLRAAQGDAGRRRVERLFDLRDQAQRIGDVVAAAACGSTGTDDGEDSRRARGA